MAVYKLFRDDFSSTYLEMIKPEYGKPVACATYRSAVGFFDALLRMLHPFMPFITEEIWQQLEVRVPGASIMYSDMPVAGEADTHILSEIDYALEIVNGVRGVRARKNIPSKEAVRLLVQGTLAGPVKAVVSKLANVGEIVENAPKDPAASAFMVGTTEFAVPQSENIDVEAEKARIKKDIDYLEGFKVSVNKKLSNERFVSNAPEAVVAAERKKLADADAKLEVLRAALQALS